VAVSDAGRGRIDGIIMEVDADRGALGRLVIPDDCVGEGESAAGIDSIDALPFGEGDGGGEGGAVNPFASDNGVNGLLFTGDSENSLCGEIDSP
jgi:hypothetical protein